MGHLCHCCCGCSIRCMVAATQEAAPSAPVTSTASSRGRTVGLPSTSTGVSLEAKKSTRRGGITVASGRPGLEGQMGGWGGLHPSCLPWLRGHSAASQLRGPRGVGGRGRARLWRGSGGRGGRVVANRALAEGRARWGER